MVVSGFGTALLALLVTAELIQGGLGLLREARHGAAVSSGESAAEPRPTAGTPRPQRPVIKAPPPVYLGESPRGDEVSDDPVVVHPPHQTLFQNEYLPIVKAAPAYPPEAALACVEGWVLLEFNVTDRGRVRDPVVIEASHPDLFHQAAVRAALEFTYVPKVLNGVTVEVQGVRYLMRFELPPDSCPRRGRRFEGVRASDCVSLPGARPARCA